MKKRIVLRIAMLAIFLLAFIFIFAEQDSYPQQNTYPGEESAREIGVSVKDFVQDLVASDTEQIGERSLSGDNGEIVGTVMGEGVTKEYFSLRAKLYEACGSKDAGMDAWDSIKLEVYERNFAEEHDILPTQEEIITFTEDMRAVAESTEESRTIALALIISVGLTEDEYWQEYKPKYETPVQLIKENIGQYRIENNLPEFDATQIECEILDQDFFNRF